MSLVLIAVIATACLGLVALFQAVTNAPEGIESENGFSFKARAKKPRSFIKDEAILEPATHVHRVTAA